MTSEETCARTVMERCNILGGYSEEPDCLIRPFASHAMRQANEAVAKWMQAAGMTVQQDAIGNLIGRYESSRWRELTPTLRRSLPSADPAASSRAAGGAGSCCPPGPLANVVHG